MESVLGSRCRLPAARIVRPAGGFTLIELLVVIGILALLMGALLPLVFGGQQAAKVVACKFNLKKLNDGLTLYEMKNKGAMPTRSGPKFLLQLWTSRTLEHTETSREYFFCPGLPSDPELERLRKTPVEELWARIDDVSGADTHYAGRNFADKSLNNRELRSGHQCLVADDNEGGPNHADGTVNFLMGDGSIRDALLAKLIEEGVMTADQQFIPVGPDSPVKELRHVIAH